MAGAVEHGKDMKRHNYHDIGRLYLAHLMEDMEYDKAARLCVKVGSEFTNASIHVHVYQICVKTILNVHFVHVNTCSYSYFRSRRNLCFDWLGHVLVPCIFSPRFVSFPKPPYI